MEQTPPGNPRGPKTRSHDDPIGPALGAALASPADDHVWDALEELAGSLQRPDEVSAAYRQVLEKELPRRVVTQIGQRAVRFHEEWFGDDLQGLVNVLERVLALDHTAEWAFKRLTVGLTVTGRWDDLLALYDRAIDSATDPSRKMALLDEAANVAKEFAGNLDRAIGYLQHLYKLKPNDPQLYQALERLLERQDRWSDRIELWRSRLDRLPREEAHKTRERIASVFLDHLDQPGKALSEIETLLATGGDDAVAVRLLERILATDTAPSEVRRGALDLLRSRYDAAGRGTDVVRTVDLALSFVGREERIGLLREAGRRLMEQGLYAEAVEHFADLLREDPHANDAEELLRTLADRTGKYDRRAIALTTAADVCTDPPRRVELLVQAADVRRTKLQDTRGAIDLYARVFASAETSPRVASDVGRRLDDLLSQGGRAPERLDVLERLAALEEDSVDRRRFLGAAGRLADELGQAERALTNWRKRLAESEHDPEALDALIRLLEREGHWDPLIDALRKRVEATDSPTMQRSDLVRIARVQIDELERAPEGIQTWIEVQRNFGEDAETVDALTQLFADEQRFEELAELLERTSGKDSLRLLEVLCRLGDVQREQLGHAERACDLYARTLSIDPTHAGARAGMTLLVEVAATRSRAVASLTRAFEVSGDWRRLIDLMEHRLSVARDAGSRSRILSETAQLQEKEAGDAAGALRSIRRAFVLVPEDVTTERTLLRLGEATNDWLGVAHGLREAAAALDAEKPASGGPAALAVEARVARLRFEEGNIYETKHVDPNAAHTAYFAVVGLEPRNAEALRRIASIERRAPGRALVDTLLRLADAAPGDLDPLQEAAEVALEILRDHELSRSILGRLFEESGRMWKTDEPSRGKRTPVLTAPWALEHLVRLYSETGAHDYAIALLAEAARLPFDAAVSRTLRRRAAEKASKDLKDRARAVDLLRSILAEVPNDADTLRDLAQLYEVSDRVGDLVTLRRHELSLASTTERRIELRLEIARLVGVLEERGGRADVLRANLDEIPGHEPSIDALCDVLETKQKYPELADILTEQAAKVESAKAAKLWARVAKVAELNLKDIDRALTAYRRVVSLRPTSEALDALARLHVQRGEHGRAVEWLERRLASAEPEARTVVALRLARAYVASGHPERTVGVLERAFAESPTNTEVRELLIELCRATEAWEPLARVLTEASAHVEDPSTLLAYAREAAEIYHFKLGRPELSIPVLERAIALVPEDRSLRMMLAEGLRIAGRLEEARFLLEGLLAEFGRRRSPERAEVHYLLAQVLRAQGGIEPALQQLDLASSMDVDHTGILKALGEVARESGQLERAERAYSALLLIVRRQQPDDPTVRVGASTVLFELHQIAQMRGQSEQSRELLDSALETAALSGAEMQRFQKTLLERGEHELLLRALDMRLGRVPERVTQAEILSDMADVLDTRLGRSSEALDARLRALYLAPGSGPIQEATRGLALRAGGIQRYVDALTELAERYRRKEENALTADLYMRLGSVYERDLGDLVKARDAYSRVEAGGEKQIQVWSALERITGALGDKPEQMRLLAALASTDASVIPEADRTDAYFRLAEIEMMSKDSIERGLASLSRALERSPEYPRAATILQRSAAGVGANHPALLNMYEQVARSCADPRMLLDAIEWRSSLQDASLENIREGVDLAMRLKEALRAEALLERAVELARTRPGGLREASWAPPLLATLRSAAGDSEGAMQWLREAAAVAGEPEEQKRLALDLASLAAGAAGDLSLAAETYERLLENDPAAREIWEPLLGVYRKLKDRKRMETLGNRLITELYEPGAKNAVRLELAKFMLEVARREKGAVTLLREVLADDPDHSEASSMLSSLFERTGEESELIELLQKRLDAAREKQDVEAAVQISLRMGAILEKSRREEAMDAYRAALLIAPQDRRLLEALLRLIDAEHEPRERAEILERLLPLEQGVDAAARALELAHVWQGLDDQAGVRRALEAGWKLSPNNETLRSRLEAAHKKSEEWERLAQMYAFDASRKKDPAQRLKLLRDAAALYRDRLDDPSGAAEMLKKARELAPEDVELMQELVSSLSAAGDHSAATAVVSEALDQHASNRKLRVTLLKLRADLLMAAGDDAGAIDDLERAYALRGAVVDELVSALEGRRLKAAASGSRDAERAATLRLVEILGRGENPERVRDLLGDWLGREPNDRDALRLVRDLDFEAGRWEQAIAVCARLVDLEQGEAQVDAALRLAEACDRASKPAEARAGLEVAYARNPQNQQLRARLRQLYESIHAWRELAQILITEAQHSPSPDSRFASLRRAGEILLRQVGDAEAATAALEQATQARPTDHDVTVLLIDAYMGAQRFSEVKQRLEAAIASHGRRRSPELAVLQHRMARLADAAGDKNAQLEWLNAALDTDKGNGDVASELAELAMKLGQDELALKALRAVTLLKNSGPMSRAVAFLKQAQIVYQRGDQRRAVLWARKARVEDPELKEVTEFLRQIGES